MNSIVNCFILCMTKQNWVDAEHNQNTDCLRDCHIKSPFNVASTLISMFDDKLSLVGRKPVFGVSDQVRHMPGCTVTEDGWKLEISDLESRGIVQLYYLCNENKGADQLRGYCEADLRLCFRICKKPVFS